MNTPESSLPWQKVEQIIRRDLTNRGITKIQLDGELLGMGQLQQAVEHFAEHAKSVAIVTGFCVVDAPIPAAETDGPPGALFLADALIALGIEVTLITDCYGLPILESGCDFLSLSRSIIREIPLCNAECVDVRTPINYDLLLRDSSKSYITHLMAIERVGPSHTIDSVILNRDNQPNCLSVAQQFEQLVPAEVRDTCQNRRGINISEFTAPAYLLFEKIQSAGLPITTIGIGDGGNEIGMGSYPWATLRSGMNDDRSGKTICRIATDFSPIAGVSNWAAYGMALTLAHVLNEKQLAEGWSVCRQERLIQHLVSQTDALDGVSKENKPTVDGLSMDAYLQQLVDLRELLGHQA